MTARFLLAPMLVAACAFRPAAAGAQVMTPSPTATVPVSDPWVDEGTEVPVLPPGFERVGDMLLEPLARPDGVTAFAYRDAAPWVGGVVPVLFDASVTANQRQYFFSLCNGVWGAAANVRCVDRTNQASWVSVTKANSGCFAAHGGPRPGYTGARQLNLQENACWSQRTVLHEIGHALGLMHEHQRPGRDQFVEIRTQNIIAGNEVQLAIINQGAGDFYTPQYDFGSIMHYHATAFSSSNQPTIVPRPQYAAIAGNFGTTATPSSLDYAVVRAVYGTVATVTVPGAPTAFSASVSGTQVHMSWGAPATGGAPTSYVVTARTAVGAVLGSWDIGNFLAASGPFAAGTYVLSVQGKNTAGTGAAATVQVTVGSTGMRPGAPANLAGTVQGSTLSLAWSAPVTPGQVQSYVLHYAFTPGFASGYTVDLGATTRVSFGGVPAGTYYMRIFARNQFGNSAESNEVRVVVGGASAPAAPSLLPPQGRGTNVFSLSWLPGAGAAAAYYLLEVSSTPTGGPDLGTLQIAGTLLETGVVPRGYYYVRVRAVNAAGTSAPSETRLVLAQ